MGVNEIAQSEEARRLYALLTPYFPSRAASLDLGRGTAFPTVGHDGAAVQAGARFWRTDLGFACYYDGTRWLTVQEYMIPVQALTTFTGPGTVAGTITALRTDYAPYFTRVEMTTVVATTNNGSNYWTCELIGVDLPFTSVSVVANPNTSADSVGVRVNHAAAAGSPAPSNRQFVRGRFTTTGSPGQLEITISAWYRLIVT